MSVEIEIEGGKYPLLHGLKVFTAISVPGLLGKGLGLKERSEHHSHGLTLEREE